MVLQAVRYTRGSLQILDQLQLPHNEIYRDIQHVEDAWYAIKEMRVRGAPAIAIVAALSLAVELSNNRNRLSSDAQTNEAKLKTIVQKLRYLVTSRPTAVNLADAARKLEKVVQDAAATSRDSETRSIEESYIAAAEVMLIDDVHDNEMIGSHGSKWILSLPQAAKHKKVSVLTHCNTGSLATAGYGTALGVVRSLNQSSSLKCAYYTETRPYNQGSRLTGYELIHDQIPATLITDSMAGALLRLKGEADNIAAIVVGADRVAANGDTANKIGTYTLAVLARQHGVKFLVAAPRTTIDLDTISGDDIVIEERPAKEMTVIRGPKVKDIYGGKVEIDVNNVETVSIAAIGTQAWNPAFDVTPAELIDGIVTEVGVFEKEDGRFSLRKAFCV
ncbi:S-methyl-5-thioribose-1-phosphate isomerase [Lambiella insularis]|nr:S-methyl-5-thioribose-1-phosphate isomerase [Lambiella insularis]